MFPYLPLRSLVEVPLIVEHQVTPTLPSRKVGLAGFQNLASQAMNAIGDQFWPLTGRKPPATKYFLSRGEIIGLHTIRTRKRFYVYLRKQENLQPKVGNQQAELSVFSL